MKNNLLFIIILLTLASCSSSWHLKRAIKKNPSIVQNSVDTIKEFIPGKIEYIFGTDSIIVNEAKVYIKVKSKNDSLELFYEFLPDTVYKIQTKTIFNAPKTRFETRYEYKILKQQGRTTRKKEDASVKKSKHKSKPNKISFLLVLIGILFGFFIGKNWKY